jgi:hypothetical protein
MKKPLQIYLDLDDSKRLEQWARARGCTKSQAIRLAIRALTRTEGEDPLLSASGMIDGLPEDLSENFDRYLRDTYIAEKKTEYRKRSRH